MILQIQKKGDIYIANANHKPPTWSDAGSVAENESAVWFR